MLSLLCCDQGVNGKANHLDNEGEGTGSIIFGTSKFAMQCVAKDFLS
jgi:hypothetical protein